MVNVQVHNNEVPCIVLDFGTSGFRFYTVQEHQLAPGRIEIDEYQDDRVLLKPFEDGKPSSEDLKRVSDILDLANAYYGASSYKKIHIVGTADIVGSQDLRNLLAPYSRNRIDVSFLDQEREFRGVAYLAAQFREDNLGLTKEGPAFFGKIGGGRSAFGWLSDLPTERIACLPHGTLDLSNSNDTVSLDARRSIMEEVERSFGKREASALIICGGIMRELDKLNQTIHPDAERCKIEKKELADLVKLTGQVSPEQLIDIYSVRKDRAPFLAISSEILQEILAKTNLNSVVVPDCGSREAVVYELTGGVPKWGKDRLLLRTAPETYEDPQIKEGHKKVNELGRRLTTRRGLRFTRDAMEHI